MASIALADIGAGHPPATRGPAFTPPSFAPPAEWPGTLAWLGAARRNALELFPRACFERMLVEHRVLAQRIVVLSDPASIALVMGSGSADYRLTNMHLRMLSPALGRGIIVAEGDRWRRQRRFAIKLVASVRDTPISGHSEGLLAVLIEKWAAADRPVAIQPDLTLLAIDLLAAELFHHRQRIGTERVLDTIGWHRTTVERADLLDVLGAPLWLQTRRLRRARSVIGGFDGEIHDAIVASERIGPQSGAIRDEARDIAVNLMSGFETIATTATWLLGLIADQPKLRDWLIDPATGAATRAARIESAVAETLRLYPPLPMIYRQALRDHETPAGLIRRGSMVCISPYVVQRHERLWGAPRQFVADRAVSARRDSPYMPFSVGARQCVGRHIGPKLIGFIVGAIIAALRPRSAGRLPLPRAGLSLRPDAPLTVDFRHG